MASTIKIQDVVKYARSFPELTPVFSDVSGWTQEPGLTIATDVLQRFLAEGMNWKFNRSLVNPVITVPLQQDYIGVTKYPTTSAVTDLSWLEHGQWVDINNTSVPKPMRDLEVERDIPPTSYQGLPFKVAWIPVPTAQMGTWTPNTSYCTGFGNTSGVIAPAGATQASLIQQFIDKNGNYLYVSGNGTTGSVSGSTQPYAAAGAAPGTTVTDGNSTPQLVWTVADPLGMALRLWPLPPVSGIVWCINTAYQKKPPILTSLLQTFDPIPDEYQHLIRQGFIAKCKEHASPGSKAAISALQAWVDALTATLKSGDREQENYIIYPSDGLMSGGVYSVPIGPSWPYRY
jgi:hypothetical protein